MDERNIASPIIEQLKEKVLSGDEMAVDRFWTGIEQKGAPIIEEIPGDNENVLVTVVWKDQGDIETIAVFGEMFGMNTDETRLDRLPDTNIWYKTYKLPAKGRSLYVFFVNEKPGAELEAIDKRLDPYNPHVVTCIDDEENQGEYCVLFKQESMIELPGFKSNPYTAEKAEVPKGSVELFRFESKLLDRSKRIWIYKPAGYDKLEQPCKLAIFMDGWEYLHETKTAVILDNMTAEGVIPPVVAVFVDNRGNRVEELRLNSVFVDFLAKEIVPWVKQKCNISNAPEDTLIGGFSAGGLTAGYAALLYPEVFGKVLSQSGAFYWGYSDDLYDAVVVGKYEQAGRLPVDVYMSLGEFEKFDYHLNANLRLYKLLKEKGYRVQYEEFMGGHTNFDCQIMLPKGIEFLFGK